MNPLVELKQPFISQTGCLLDAFRGSRGDDKAEPQGRRSPDPEAKLTNHIRRSCADQLLDQKLPLQICMGEKCFSWAKLLRLGIACYSS